MHRTDCARIFGHPHCTCERRREQESRNPDIVLPVPYDTYHYKSSETPIWQRIRNRARVIFSTDRTSHEMVLVFEALQDLNLRLEALEKERDTMRVEIPRT